MQVAHVREVEQVVGEQLIVCVEVQIAGRDAPGRVVEPREVGNSCGVGLRGLAHPNPRNVPALDDGIAPHAHVVRHVRLPRNLDARTGAIELQAVIAALHDAVLENAARERSRAVATAVFECRDAAVARAEEDDRLVEQAAR